MKLWFWWLMGSGCPEVERTMLLSTSQPLLPLLTEDGAELWEDLPSLENIEELDEEAAEAIEGV